MLPQISIDTANTNPVEEVTPTTTSPAVDPAYEKSGRLTVPGIRGYGTASDGSSSGNWDGSTTYDKSRNNVVEHARSIVNQDDSEEVGSFAFTNKQLQALVDPKELELLRQLGGLHGLERGLQSDLKSGLSWDETVVPVRITLAEAQAASGSTIDDRPSKESTFVAPAMTKKPTFLRKSMTARSTMKASDDKMQDRKRVYGINVLPARKTKNILQLMWIALQDKVLIILSIAAVVSLALGLYETFSGEAEIDPLSGRPIPHVEWVEGVAIIVAIAIVTIVGSLNDYQKERQFTKLNKKVY